MSTDPQPAPTTLSEVWNRFSHLALDPVGAHRIQRQEMRRAFYAGASAVLTILTQNMTTDEGEPTQADFALMDNLVQELDSFKDAVAHGRA